MSLIYDENTVRSFFRTVFPDVWERTEGAFISLAARKKYIPEGVDIDLGHRPQMLDKDVVRSRNEDVYIAKLRRFTAPDAYTVDILPGQGQGIPAQTPATGMPCTPRVVLQGLAGMRVMPTLCYRQAVFPAISSSSILSPSLRIFIAAFRSRSIVKPHLSHT